MARRLDPWCRAQCCTAAIAYTSSLMSISNRNESGKRRRSLTALRKIEPSCTAPTKIGTPCFQHCESREGRSTPSPLSIFAMSRPSRAWNSGVVILRW